jgi:hypothetical protein
VELVEFRNNNGHEVSCVDCILCCSLGKLIYNLVNFLLASLDMFPAYLFVIVP